MKILIPLINFGPQGGYRVLSELANHWILMGHEVQFLVHKKSMVPNFPTNATISWYDHYGRISQRNDVNHKSPLLRVFAIMYGLIKAINSCDFDVILATHSLTAWPVVLSKKCDKKFYYIQAYEPDYYQGNNLADIVFRTLSKLSYKLKLKRIVNSPLYFDYQGIRADKYVFPGIDFTKFYPNKKTENHIFVVGCIGRIEPYKGTSYVLEAFKKLRKELGTSVELHVAFGDSSLEKVDGVKVVKIKNDVELALYYNSVQVIVAPGTVQLGAVHYPVIEAMSCKTPVITTGYYPADAGNSWIVPIKDSESIYASILEMMNNQAMIQQKIENGYAQVQEFDWHIVSAKMLSYFEYN